jgi:hypothetical protein
LIYVSRPIFASQPFQYAVELRSVEATLLQSPFSALSEKPLVAQDPGTVTRAQLGR